MFRLIGGYDDMTILTATNQRVQFYMTYTKEKPTTAAKYKRLASLQETLLHNGKMLDEVFPTKQLAVLDFVLYLTSGSGIAKVGADTLAAKCGVSTRTVYNAVKALKNTGEFIIARLIKSKGGVGKYIFVDKKHVNFTEIMREVFALSDVNIAKQFAEQNSIEAVAPVGLEGNKSSFNLNIFSIKQEKENYISDNELIKQSIEEEQIEKNRAYVEQYASNPLQISFYDVLSVMPYDSSIHCLKHVLALRIGSDCDIKRFIIAKKVIHSIAMRINEGYEFNNIVATFSAALNNALNYKKVINEDSMPTYKVPVVSFYDWLENRN